VLNGSPPPTLVVTGHPNHELAILGLVQRWRPRLLFLTDGGGPERVDDSRHVLDELGLLDHAHFLGWPESRLYQALLDGDYATFGELVAEVRSEVAAHGSRRVLCESIELYNPLHDVTLPIVRAALQGRRDVEILEFPLIAQVPVEEELYRIQRMPTGRTGESYHLTADELAIKIAARASRYGSLRRQLGPVLDGLGREHLAREVFASAAAELPTPGRDHALRYERRGRLLRERGEIATVITFTGHFLPLVAALDAGSTPPAA
jgi:hypothetical protein